MKRKNTKNHHQTQRKKSTPNTILPMRIKSNTSRRVLPATKVSKLKRCKRMKMHKMKRNMILTVIETTEGKKREDKRRIWSNSPQRNKYEYKNSNLTKRDKQ